MYKAIITTFLIFILVQNSFAQNGESELSEPVTVEYVNLDKYAGLWYEIARIPNRFQKDCTGNTTAQYSIREDGMIDVVNSCIQADGSADSAKGIARIVDTKSNAKLEVSFVRFLGINLFWGDYWIIGLDENYQYAVVGHPERKYGWILSRTPALSENQLDKIFSMLKLQGYNPDKFVMTKQNQEEL